VTALKAESGGVEQNLGTVGEGELAVAEVLTLFLIIGNCVVTRILGSTADHPITSNRTRLRSLSKETDIRSKRLPLGNLEVLGVDEVGGEARNVNGRLGLNRRDWAGAGLLIYGCERLRKLTSLGQLERRKIRGITSWDLANLTESGDGTSDNTARLRITNGGFNLDKAWEELG
jgi:hypothetical protein